MIKEPAPNPVKFYRPDLIEDQAWFDGARLKKMGFTNILNGKDHIGSYVAADLPRGWTAEPSIALKETICVLDHNRELRVISYQQANKPGSDFIRTVFKEAASAKRATPTPVAAPKAGSAPPELAAK